MDIGPFMKESPPEPNTSHEILTHPQPQQGSTGIEVYPAFKVWR